MRYLLGEKIYTAVCAAVAPSDITEIRLRVGRAIAVKDAVGRTLLPITCTAETISEVVRRATKSSLYAYQDELASGFIHYEGGIRLGLTGTGVTDGDRLITYKEITSLNVRIPHEIIGCSSPLKEILDNFENTLVISPPFGGKTTLIRDMTRVLSARFDVTMVDEREELYAPTYRFGALLDVIRGTPKRLAVEGVIRAMSPEIVVLDELYPERDMPVIEALARSGIKLLASIHAENAERLTTHAPELIRHFRYGVVLGYKPRVGSIKSIVGFTECSNG